MLIRCWGARGSIPVSGETYLRYGGDTPCMEIRTANDEIVIIDAGSGARRLGNRLIDEGRYDYTLIFTHAHWDHIMGFPFFKPIYRQDTHIRLMGCPFAQRTVREMIARIMTPPNFPVNFEEIRATIDYEETCALSFSVGSLAVTPIALSHPNQGIGYRFEEDGKSFVFLTDNELGFQHPGGLGRLDYVQFCRNADLLFHDAQYTDEEYKRTRGWGHSTYAQAIDLAIEAGVKSLVLFHHDPDRTDDDLDRQVERCRQRIEKAGAALQCEPAAEGMVFEL